MIGQARSDVMQIEAKHKDANVTYREGISLGGQRLTSVSALGEMQRYAQICVLHARLGQTFDLTKACKLEQHYGMSTTASGSGSQQNWFGTQKTCMKQSVPWWAILPFTLCVLLQAICTA